MSAVQRLQHASIPIPPGGQATGRAFYNRVLGMEEATPPSTLDVRNLVWFRAGLDGQEVHLFVDEHVGRNSPAQHLCLQVDDIGAFRERLTSAGVPIDEATAVYNRPRFFIHDPFGNLIEITQIVGEYR